MEDRREQIWQYRLNGQDLVSPSESFAANRDPKAFLIYESDERK